MEHERQRYQMGYLAALLAILLGATASAQLHDMRWLGGYLAGPAPEWGGNKTIFYVDAPAASVVEDLALDIQTTIGVFTDESDSILAYTNGWSVANREYQIMPSGSGLNPSDYFSSDEGFLAPSSHIFLPWPSKPDSIALIHMVVDSVSGVGTYISRRLYLTIADRNLDNGLGDLVLKNHELLHAPLICGGLSAVRHANGRDWWVFTHSYLNNEFISFLLTPSGFIGPYYQSIGSVRSGPSPGVNFNMEGDRLASSATGSEGTGLDVFDFDRCTGVLSNWQHADLTRPLRIGGSAFSGNGDFIYVAHVDTLYQFSIVGGILGGPITVAYYDGFFDTYPAFATYFRDMSLAPDGCIYITTGNSTRYMHVIRHPDEGGLSSNVMQHAHVFPTWTFNSIPHRPNYVLGPADGTVCDSLGLNAGLVERAATAKVRVQPNPNSGSFSIAYPGQSQAGELEILDAAGRVVYRHRLSAWSTVHAVELPQVAPGLYHCKLTFGARTMGARVLITEMP
ncbi:MAG: T9SS type A sorting domain-containing protein [Flavobacteriales bacterium]|nr:T9SS type A sorting domain-containing protein [Flavobacteriales bacterium]